MDNKKERIKKIKLIKYKINRYGITPIYGVLLHEGNQWIVTKDNVVDYVLDGIRFINRKYISYKKKIEVDDDEMKVKIIPLKYKDALKDKELVAKLDLNSYHGFFSMLKPMGYMTEIGLDKEDSMYVGTIAKINEKSVTFDTIGTLTEDTGMMNIPFDRIRYIGIETDYLKSLSLYIKHQGK